ncbi:MAG: UbiA family prenyltransferase [Verrucomicrobiaceae bacterium]|nr:UbiA family prenyltransferase [Verrucomicrobiaceae bacterium]
MLKAWLELARISNLPTVWTNVLAGWMLGGGGFEDSRLIWLLAGASLLYSAGMIMNDAADADWDREHRKERPIPRGDVKHGTAWRAGMTMLVLGAACMHPFGGASATHVSCLCFCILAYDLCHKQWAGSVFVMGACRTLLYLAAGSAVKGSVSLEWNSELIAAALAMGLYIVGISMAARNESAPVPAARSTSFTMLCLLSPLIAPLAAALLYSLIHEGPYAEPAAIILVRRLGGVYLGGFAVIGLALVMLVRHAMRMMRTPPLSNIGRAVGLLLAGIVVVDGLAVASLGGFLEGCAIAALTPLLRLWQRKIAAT